MDDWEKYEQLADTPKYRDDFEFAMYGATHFGMKAIPILSTAPTYGDKYPELIKQACATSREKGDAFGRVSDIDSDFMMKSGCFTSGYSNFKLYDMAQYCDQQIIEIKAERLHEKITMKLSVKQSPPTRGIKI
jgi:hypothetical protein